MLGLMAWSAYVGFVLATAALVWAVRELSQAAGKWEPGTNPHKWRF